MRRRIARSVFILLCGALATGLGVLGALLYTPPGRVLLARIVSDQAPRFIRGSVHLGSVRGNWVRGFTVEHLTIRDTAGVLLLSSPRVEVRYRLASLLTGHFVLSAVRVYQPVLQIIKHRGGRANFEEILRLGESPPGGASPLVELHDLTIVDGTVTIRMPWNPDGRLRTAGQVDSALVAERSKPGRRIEPGREGLELVRTIEELNAQLPLLRIATPDRLPVLLEIGQLSARINDPLLDIRQARGNVRTRGDSLLFELRQVELPRSSLSGSGRLDWPEDTIRYHFSLQAPKLALADLRFISPKFPDFTGSGRVQAASVSNTRTEYDIRELSLGDATSSVKGRVVTIGDVYRGLGFRGFDVLLNNFDLDVVRPYLDTLPFYGKLTGRLDADGFFDDMVVSFDWIFRDAHAQNAESRIMLDGDLKLGGALGIVFQNAELSETDLDLRTVRLLAPAVILDGRLALNGMLNGPLKNVVFNGRAEHRDSTLPASRFKGMVRLDTRDTLLALETDIVLDSLVFAGIRRAFPTLKTRGALGGSVKLAGYLSDLAVDAIVGGGLGRLEVHGRATVLPPRWGADSLRVRFEALDLATLMGSGPPTSLAGRLAVTGTADSARAPEGVLAVELGRSRIREITLDSASALLHARDSVITVDTLRAFWQELTLAGAGTLGYAPPKTGRLALHVDARELAALDSLARRLTGFTPDTSAQDSPLHGVGRADLTLSGALGALRIEATASVDTARWLAYRGKAVKGHFLWTQADNRLAAELLTDTLWRRELVLTGIDARVKGRPDSLQWYAAVVGKDLAKVHAGGSLEEITGGTRLRADSLRLELLNRTWGLAAPLNARFSPAVISLDTVLFVTSDGSGSIRLAGELPRSGPGELSVTALGVELRDIYGLLQRDTSGIAGVVAVDAKLGGTALAPELRGSGTLTGPVFGDFKAPLIRAAFDYRQQQLRGNLTFWRTGKPVVEADLTLPLDLALQPVPRRQLPGPLDIVVRGDSIDLALAEAFTPNLRQVSGLLNVDARVQGTWEAPRLAGRIGVINGAAYIPGLGVTYHSINGVLRLAQDSILAEPLRIGTRDGTLELGGGIRLQRLTQPILNLAITANDFELINVADYMTLRSSGTVQLTGTLEHPVLTGQGRLNNSVIYFADLVQKDIVNLQDPLYADLVDTLALRKYSLGANFQSRFLDSLTVRDLDLEIGEAVWLRSNEANFQLEGRLRVSKNRLVYSPVGDLDTPRGTYTLKAAGFINRTFTVERGTVRYFGDLNAQLDVQAEHVVRTPGSGQDIPVIAHITGTLLVPKLNLSSPSDRAPMTEGQLMSLLVTGTPEVGLGNLSLGTNGLPALSAAAVATTALSSELQRSLASTLGLDFLEIRPPTSSSFTGGVSGRTQVAFGTALGPKLFAIANAGFCLGGGQSNFSARNLGASLEYRFSRELRAQLAAEPVQTCLVRGVDIFGISKRYQFGADMRWDRSY